MYDEASRKLAEINETFLEMLPTMRRRDLEQLIKKRPALWGHFAPYLTSGHAFVDDPPARTEHHATRKSPARLNREIAEVLARKSSRHHSTISDDTDDTKIRDAIARFPATFSLRGFPGDLFRLSPTASYVSDGSVILYTQRKKGDRWQDFAKGTEPELRGQIVSSPSTGGRTTRGHATRMGKRSAFVRTPITLLSPWTWSGLIQPWFPMPRSAKL